MARIATQASEHDQNLVLVISGAMCNLCKPQRLLDTNTEHLWEVRSMWSRSSRETLPHLPPMTAHPISKIFLIQLFQSFLLDKNIIGHLQSFGSVIKLYLSLLKCYICFHPKLKDSLRWQIWGTKPLLGTVVCRWNFLTSPVQSRP